MQDPDITSIIDRFTKFLDPQKCGVIPVQEIWGVIQQLTPTLNKCRFDELVEESGTFRDGSVDYRNFIKYIFSACNIHQGEPGKFMEESPNQGPFVIFVNFEVAHGKEQEFLELMKTDARETQHEEGNLYFDVLKVQGSENKYCLYEAFVDEAAANAHTKTPHYKMWNEFKKAGGVVAESYNKVLMNSPNFSESYNQ